MKDHSPEIWLYILLGIALLSKGLPYLSGYFLRKRSIYKSYPSASTPNRNFVFYIIYDIVVLLCSFYFFYKFIAINNKWLLFSAGVITFLLWEWLPHYIL